MEQLPPFSLQRLRLPTAPTAAVSGAFSGLSEPELPRTHGTEGHLRVHGCQWRTCSQALI